MTADRLGLWSSAAVATIGSAYVVLLIAGFARHGFEEPIRDPILAGMEVLTLASAWALVVLMAAVLERAPIERKVFGRVALAFATLCAGTTSVVHFVELTAGRQMGASSFEWPSSVYAAELLAWDGFLGLALLFAAAVFDGAPLGRSGRERAIRRTLSIAGVLCLAGILGPALGDMRLQRIGIVGYAGVLPVAAFLLARWFASARRD